MNDPLHRRVWVSAQLLSDYRAAGGETFFRRDNLVEEFARRFPPEGPLTGGPITYLQIRCLYAPTRHQVESVLVFLTKQARTWRAQQPS
jgi:hypothetical protein